MPTRYRKWDWTENSMTENQLLGLLEAKINMININYVKDDVIRFIPNPESLAIWSSEYFIKLCSYLKVSEKL